MTRLIAVAIASVLAASAHAEPKYTLRMATAAPDGTAWAREIRAYTRNLEDLSHGQLTLKWYFGGIAGNELEMGERIGRDQLDGAASGGMLCQRLSPSVRVFRVHGLFQTRDEVIHTLSRLHDTLAAEARRNGYVLLGTTVLGPDVIFSRTPITRFAELKALRIWRWDLDETGIANSRGMGLTIVSTPVERAARAYDDNQIDGFIGVPAAVLAFQWSTRARYLSDLRIGFLPTCILVANRAFDRLPIELQQVLRAATAKVAVRVNDSGRQMDDQLLGSVFAKQGVTNVPVSESLRAQFFDAARSARDALGEQLVPRALLERVMTLLGDFRAERREPSR